MDSGFLGLPPQHGSGKIAQRAALSAARSRQAKSSLRDVHGALCGHTERGFFMATPEQLTQHIQDTDAVWALEGFKRTAFTNAIAAKLEAGSMTPAEAVEAMKAELQRLAAPGTLGSTKPD